MAGAFDGFDDALTALLDACPMELTFLHPQSVKFFFCWIPVIIIEEFFEMVTCV
jgi:hypothetical protein